MIKVYHGSYVAVERPDISFYRDTLELYFAKLIPEEEALDRLKYEKPNRQICICRQALIGRRLSFESAQEVVRDGSR